MTSQRSTTFHRDRVSGVTPIPSTSAACTAAAGSISPPWKRSAVDASMWRSA